MTIKWLTLLFMMLMLSKTDAQTYQTLNGQVNFSSVAREENIDAENNSVAAQLVANNGKGQFIIPIKSFRFRKALLQEHFNENYLESDTYPRATYKYTITAVENVNFTKAGRYAVQTTGVMTIKNTSKKIEVPGYVTIVDSKTIRLEAVFSLSPSDYGITIPKLVEDKIAKNIKISVNSTLNKK